MKILIGICSCHKNKEYRKAVRATWLKGMPKNISYIFFVGEGKTREKDVVSLPVKDDYESLPKKVQAFYNYALNNLDFDCLFKCDDDTIVFTDRLPSLLESESDFVGNDLWWKHNNHMDGGAGYLLSKKAINIIVNTPHTEHDTTCEDVWVTKLLKKSNVKVTSCSLLKPRYIEDDSENNEAITLHKIKADSMKYYYAHGILKNF